MQRGRQGVQRERATAERRARARVRVAHDQDVLLDGVHDGGRVLFVVLRQHRQAVDVPLVIALQLSEQVPVLCSKLGRHANAWGPQAGRRRPKGHAQRFWAAPEPSGGPVGLAGVVGRATRVLVAGWQRGAPA